MPSKQGCNCHFETCNDLQRHLAELFLACFHCSAGDINVCSGDLTNLQGCGLQEPLLMRIVGLIVTLEPEEWFDNCLSTPRR